MGPQSGRTGDALKNLDETQAYRAAFTGSEGVYRSRELPGFWLRVEWLWKQPSLFEVLRE